MKIEILKTLRKEVITLDLPYYLILFIAIEATCTGKTFDQVLESIIQQHIEKMENKVDVYFKQAFNYPTSMIIRDILQENFGADASKKVEIPVRVSRI